MSDGIAACLPLGVTPERTARERRVATWLASLGKHLDYLRNRYDAFPVRDEHTRAAAMQVLDDVRRKELNRVHGRSALESAAFVDADVRYDLYAVTDTRTGKVVGCIRITTADQIASIPASRDEYCLDRLPPALLARTQVFTRLAILPEYRKTAASLALLRRLCKDALAADMRASLLACEPGLFPGYARLGFRPLGSVHQSPSGGFRIPMVALLHDVDHARRVRSPLRRLVSAIKGPLPQDAVRWYRELEARNGPIDPGVSFHADDSAPDVHAALTSGLTARGRRELLRNAMEIQCRPGDIVISAGDGGKSMGLVLRGSVRVEQAGRAVATLGRGEVFGETAVVTKKNHAVSIVAAGDNTRVLTLSQSCLARLRDPADLAQVWCNLARIIAGRQRPVLQ
jgi:cyclic nucleotide-binding protein/GNAT acetyltransferase-like protein